MYMLTKPDYFIRRRFLFCLVRFNDAICAFGYSVYMDNHDHQHNRPGITALYTSTSKDTTLYDRLEFRLLVSHLHKQRSEHTIHFFIVDLIYRRDHDE